MKNELTEREQEIFDLNTLCLTRSEMCEKLFISKRTLHSHLTNIAAKLAIPERMNIQYYMVCLRLKQLQKKQKELENTLNKLKKQKKDPLQNGSME